MSIGYRRAQVGTRVYIENDRSSVWVVTKRFGKQRGLVRVSRADKPGIWKDIHVSRIDGVTGGLNGLRTDDADFYGKGKKARGARVPERRVDCCAVCGSPNHGAQRCKMRSVTS
jgi:hypothetical protein